jgi:hypothetical protein
MPIDADLEALADDGPRSQGMAIPSANPPPETNLYSRWNSAGAIVPPAGGPDPDLQRTRQE